MSIGVHALEIMREPSGERGTRTLALLHALAGYESLASAIHSFWLEPAHQQIETWTEHRDINEVMLATSLAPHGFLALQPRRHNSDRGTDLAPP